MQKSKHRLNVNDFLKDNLLPWIHKQRCLMDHIDLNVKIQNYITMTNLIKIQLVIGQIKKTKVPAILI